MWRVSLDFHRPLPLKQHFPTFHYRTSSFCCQPIFSSLEPSKPMKSKFISSPLRKRFWTSELELWLAIHEVIDIYSKGLTESYIYLISNPCSDTLLKFHFLEAILHNVVLKFRTHSIEYHQLPIKLKPYLLFKIMPAKVPSTQW